jgi:hypothetical protein
VGPQGCGWTGQGADPRAAPTRVLLAPATDYCIRDWVLFQFGVPSMRRERWAGVVVGWSNRSIKANGLGLGAPQVAQMRHSSDHRGDDAFQIQFVQSATLVA